RLRFPVEVFKAVSDAVGADIPVWVRISASDWVEGGWDVEGSIALAKALKAEGLEAIHVSSGGLSPQQKITLGPNYQVGFAREIRAATGLTTIAVGLITEPAQAEKILTEGEADAIGLARAMLYDPRWPWHAAAELGATVKAPPQYWRCQPHELKSLFKTTA
ncbi:oxidoreductase, partial [Thioclava sp. BHET1]